MSKRKKSTAKKTAQKKLRGMGYYSEFYEGSITEGRYTAPESIRIFPAGLFDALDSRGSLTVDIDTVIESFRKAGKSLLIDFEHELFDKSGNYIPATPNSDYEKMPRIAGWITDLSNQDGEIWGAVEWSDEAAALISKGEYRHFSPNYYYMPGPDGEADTIVGIFAGALTRDPALPLGDIASKHNEEVNEMPEWLTTALGLKTDATDEQAKTAFNALAAQASASTEAQELLQQVSKALEVGKDGDIVEAAIAAKQATDLANFVPKNIYDDLRDRLESAKESDVEKAVASAIKAGKVKPADKAWAMASAQADLKAFNEMVGIADPKVNTQTTVAKQAAKAADECADEITLTDAEKAIARQMGQRYDSVLAAKKADAERNQ